MPFLYGSQNSNGTDEPPLYFKSTIDSVNGRINNPCNLVHKGMFCCKFLLNDIF